ncbi:DUF1772 domain-containing protein [Streptomyces sanyensis]|uniref:DUF1772 domain-containing protein n=1 Tax=Streptomyces sanyensis TaxID=568869 RepID=A0ABP8ZSR8_9ACTN
MASTIPTVFRVFLIAALLAMGAIAGFFYAYEVSVTTGLAEVDDATYVTAMQAINSVIRNAPFAMSFFGAIVLTAVALVLAWRAAGRRSATFWLIAAALATYLLGGFGVTFALNVPLNEELAGVSLTAHQDLSGIRADYESQWNRWNTLRTVASLAAFALLAGSAVTRTGRPRRG